MDDLQQERLHMRKPLVTKFGEFWQRSEMFKKVEENGRVNWSERGWYDKNGKKAPLEGARGIYVLYSGKTPIYVGKAIKGTISNRLRNHAQDWYSYAWDNVSWFCFDESLPDSYIDAVEAILIANIPGTLNGSQPRVHLGKRCYLGDDKNHAKNTLWQKS